MQAIAPVMVLFSILFPSKMWFAPDQPINIGIRGAGQDVTLVLLDFLGKPVEGDNSVEISGDRTIDLRQYWPQFRSTGTYILFAVPKGKPTREFIGTPLVIGVRDDRRREAPPGPMVVKIEPLRYAAIETEKGSAMAMFFYDAAPDTTSNFITLAEQGFYDGLAFHEIIPGFKIQGGDPRGDGTGGPGYHIEAEFNSRRHEEGVLSMSRQTDPIEAQGLMPRSEFANSAGSQFFICLDYNRTKQLDGRYAAFGRIVQGIEAIREIAKVPVDPKTNRPLTPQIIKSVKVMPVTSDRNPYMDMLNLAPATRPAL